MKKSQRNRLAALQALATHSAAEQAELAWLQLLAAAHSDASKDEDDTSAPGVLKAALLKFTAATTDRQRLAQANSELAARVKNLEAGGIGSASLAAVVTAAGLKAADLAGKDAAAIAAAILATAKPADANASAEQVTKLTGERDALAASRNEFLVALGFKADELLVSAANMEKFGLKDDDAWKQLTDAQKVGKLAAAAVDHAISARTLAQVSELGFDAKNLPKQQNGDKAADAAALRDEYAALLAAGKATEAGAFFRKNYDAMYPASGGNN